MYLIDKKCNPCVQTGPAIYTVELTKVLMTQINMHSVSVFVSQKMRCTCREGEIILGRIWDITVTKNVTSNINFQG